MTPTTTGATTLSMWTAVTAPSANPMTLTAATLPHRCPTSARVWIVQLMGRLFSLYLAYYTIVNDLLYHVGGFLKAPVSNVFVSVPKVMALRFAVVKDWSGTWRPAHVISHTMWAVRFRID